MLDSKPHNNVPFNAADIDFRQQHLRVYELLSMISERKLDLFEDDLSLRKYLDTWDSCGKSLFIESLMLDFPLPPFYFDGSLSRWKIIDGINRILAFYQFISGEYRLTGLEYYVKEAENCFYDELPGYLRNRINNKIIIANIINPGTPLPIRYNIFQRINTIAGTDSTKAPHWQYGIKIRNVFFRGKVNGLIRKLNKNNDFQTLTKHVIITHSQNKTIFLREYVTQFIAFKIMGISSYWDNMEEYVSTALLSLYQNFDDYEEKLIAEFNRGMRRMRALSLNASLISVISEHPILFNAFATNLASMSSEDFVTLKERSQSFSQELDITTFRFSSKPSVIFHKVDRLIKKHIQ